MPDSWMVIAAALLYLCALFGVAWFCDRRGGHWLDGRLRMFIYPLTIAVYCTSWTFYGSVGFAARSGLDFLMIYVGPALALVLGARLIMRIIALSRAQNITSVADFVAARYGKSQKVAAVVALIAVTGSVPYIALQLKAVSVSLTTFLVAIDGQTAPWMGWISVMAAGVLALFAVAFGARRVDATEHQQGLVAAIAVESIVKLAAFLAVGLFITYVMFGGVADIVARADAISPMRFLEMTSSPLDLATLLLLSACAALLLPRQFHMMVVENRRAADAPRMAWMFAAYLALINLFVIPIALAGISMFPTAVDRDMTLLQLPLHAGAGWVALLAFIGGLSAATAMVIVDSVALAIMISNDLVMPVLLRWRSARSARGLHIRSGMGPVVLGIRRCAIVAVVALAWLYNENAANAALAATGLLSFAAIAQIAPPFIGGLIWRRGTALGAVAGLSVGWLAWGWMLLLPAIADPQSLGGSFLTGPFGLRIINPAVLTGAGPENITPGVLWSLGLNIVFYVTCSLLRPASAIERLQAYAFRSPEPRMSQSPMPVRGVATFDDLYDAVTRYLGEDRARSAFAGFNATRQEPARGPAPADIQTIRFAEHLLASVIGAASSRLMLSLLNSSDKLSSSTAMALLDDASAAIQYNRDVLQNALDHAQQGITILDHDMRILAWNQAFVDLYDLPPDFVRVGVGLDAVVTFNATRGAYGPGHVDDLVADRLASLLNDGPPARVKLFPGESVIEIRSNKLPGGGFVTTYTEVTREVEAEEALEAAYATLEKRVEERTQELMRLNVALTRAKSAADEANQSKTRFLAAASHDILQPLNAARLYAAALVERPEGAGEARPMIDNIVSSLDAVEEILTALLDISRLDAGQMRAEFSIFPIGPLLDQLQREFAPMAREKGLKLTVLPSSLHVRSDRRLLRRLLQNLISNAIKYTPSGKVLVGCRRHGDRLRVAVADTGLGIPESKQRLIFREFQRLDQGMREARGLGLGLSIVERIAHVLHHKVSVTSTPGRGSLFAVTMPVREPVATPDSARPAPPPTTPLTGMRILAIDNEPAILEGMRALLEGWGCEVAAGGSLEEANRVIGARRFAPDIVIADYHLDEGDGLEAITRLRWRLGPGLHAVLLTADRSPEVRAEAQKKNAHVLHKPLKPAALRALLTQWRARME